MLKKFDLTTDKQATQSLSGILTETATQSPADSVEGQFTGLWSQDPNSAEDSVVLEYPMPVATEEFNHFMVFNIYDAVSATMSIEEQKLVIDVLSRGFVVGHGAAAGAGVAGALAGRKVFGGPWWLKAALMLVAGGGAAYTANDIGNRLTLAAATDAERAAVEKHNKMIERQVSEEKKVDSESLKVGRTARLGKAYARQKETIALYMPQKISVANSLDYDSQDFSFIQGITKDWVGLASKLIIAKIPGVVDTLASWVGTNTNLDSALQAVMRIAPNPRKQLVFNEPAPRRYEYTFNFFPRNEWETARAYEIIKTFKKYAYPELNQIMGHGTYYSFPAEFEIKYYTVQGKEAVENDWLPKIGRCALKEITVDYSAAGTYATFENGAPVAMSLSLIFEEMELVDRDLITKGY